MAAPAACLLACLSAAAGIRGAQPAAPAAAQPAPVGRLCQVRLLTDVGPDLTSLESVVRAVVRPDMPDEEKCLALFWVAHDRRYWYPAFYPREKGRAVYDPILLLNCYPAIICQQDAALTTALWAEAGFDVRYWQLGGHTTGEVYYGGRWHNFDATNGRYVRTPDGEVSDVTVSQRFYKATRDSRGRISRVEPFDDFEIGHRMNFTLRRNEAFTRYWHPLGDGPDYWRSSNTPGKRADDRGRHRLGLKASMSRKPYRFNTKGAGIANGRWEFRPDFRLKGWQDLFEKTDNVAADADGRLLAPVRPGRPAELIWRVATPYTITGAWVESDFAAGEDGRVRMLVSADQGASWKELAPIAAGRRKSALREHVAGGWEYLVRLILDSPSARSIRVAGLSTSTVVQVNPLSLPALRSGRTTVRVSAGEQVETFTIYPSLETAEWRAHVVAEENVAPGGRPGSATLRAKDAGKDSSIVLKIDASGPVRQVRWGGRLLTVEGDLNEMLYSANGTQWRKQRMTSRWTRPGSTVPNRYTPFYETTLGWPENARTVFLKYRFVRSTNDLTLLSAFRIDLDYQPPGRTSTLPMEVTFCWEQEEAGRMVEKTHTQIVRRVPFAYPILVGGKEKPLMKWLRLSLYDGGSDSPSSLPVGPKRAEPRDGAP